MSARAANRSEYPRLRQVDQTVLRAVDEVAHAPSNVASALVHAADRLGSVAQQPPTWAGAAAVLALTGPAGRRAAARAVACYAATGVVANLVVKPLVTRRRPPPARRKLIGPVTSSFPSGHAATHVAFVFAAGQELPASFLPLATLALAAHWSLVRSQGHYPSDVVAGGLLGLAVALTARRVWAPTAAAEASEEPSGRRLRW